MLYKIIYTTLFTFLYMGLNYFTPKHHFRLCHVNQQLLPPNQIKQTKQKEKQSRKHTQKGTPHLTTCTPINYLKQKNKIKFDYELLDISPMYLNMLQESLKLKKLFCGTEYDPPL